MKKGGIFIISSCLFISSCSFSFDYGENVSNNYENITPYINIEKTIETKYYDINIDEYALKMERNDTFI